MKRNRDDILPLTSVTTYARKDNVHNGDGTLFAVDHIYKDSKKEKSCRFFRMNFIEFYQRLMVTPRDRRCYYECIEGDKRKPYADIEYEYTDTNKDKAFEDFDLIIGYLLLGIQYEMHDKGVDYLEERDCIKLSSHGPGKRSMHIIINNHYFDKCKNVNESNVKYFWLAVRNRVPKHLWHFAKIKHGSETVEKQVDPQHNKPLIIDTIRSYKKKDQSETIDTCVYSSFRQFRLLWNTKLGKDRYLDIDPSTGLQARFPKNPGDPNILDENIQRLRLFEGCLITMISNCKQLPDWVAPVNIKQQAAIRNLVDINSNQRYALIDAFNSSRHSQVYRINHHQSTSNNSLYLDPIVKPYDCLVCGGNHSGNNAKLCYSAKGNIYIKCFASNMIDYIGKDTINEDSDDDASDFEDVGEPLKFLGLDHNYLQYAQKNGIEVPDNVVKAITDCGNNHLNDYSSQNHQQLVQATPIINGIIDNEKVTAQVHDGFTTGGTQHVINNPIIYIQTTSWVPPVVKEGQTVPPSSTTTIASFLDGNTKILAGDEYIIRQLYDAYEKYRCGHGAKYNLSNGDFGKALTSLGHSIGQKKIEGTKVRVVTLKRPDPLVSTNPVEALNVISDKTAAETLKPGNALALLQQNFNNKNVLHPVGTAEVPITPVTNIITANQLVNMECFSFDSKNQKANCMPGQYSTCREMNQHVDVRNFWDIYMTQDPNSNTDPDNLFKCFLEYCKQNNAVPNRFGKTRLLNYIKKWLNIDIDGRMIKGWRCKIDMEEIENANNEKKLRRIWEYNSAPYHIGWHNGKSIERYSKLTSRQWKKIDVHYRHDEYCQPIPQLIEMTNAYEKNLPDRVKEIQERQLYCHLQAVSDNEANKLRVSVINALLAGVIVENSHEHVALRNRIEQLEQEAIQRNREEYDRLEASIKDDKDRLLQEISWCCAVRSTFRTGKTYNLRPYIEAFPEMRVLIVLPRTTLTDEYIIEYRAIGFVVYTEKPKGKINDPRVIVCYPSITRLDLTVNYDLLVLDEYKAIKDLQHTLVKKMMRKKDKITGIYKSCELKCYQVLCQLVANTKRVYVADALLTNAHVLEIAKMRSLSEEYSKRVTVYQNLYQKHRGNIVYTVNNQDLLTHKIINLLREGKRVAVPTNIKGYGEFLHKKIMDLDINVTVSLSTGDNRPTKSLVELWHNVQCMIYSPTILAGNSYEEPIDVVCGYFEKSSCDQADALQMLMRCREITSRSYYICFKEGPGKSPIPYNVYQSTEEVKNFFMRIKKTDMIGWSEEDLLSLDADGYGHIRYHNMYLNSYINFMKQGLVSDREYLFRMLLYMRDAGFSYGGNIYTKTDDKEEVAAIKVEKKEYSKERNEDELNEKYTCANATTLEYQELTKKTNKTKDDLRRILKYRIKRIYNVDNVPKWLFKIHKRNYKQYVRIKKYISVNGVTDTQQRYNLISHINELQLDKCRLRGVQKDRQSDNMMTTELLQAIDIYDPVDDIENFWTERHIQHCVHALTILESIGATNFIRDVSRFEISYNEFNNPDRLKVYIVHYERELRELVNDSKISIDNLPNKVTNTAFGIKFHKTTTGYSIENLWVLNQNNLWPVNYDPNDREDLQVFVPEPTVSEKSKTWINDKIGNVSQPIAGILRVPPKGTCVSNKVLVPATTTTKGQQDTVQQSKRIQARPIIFGNFKLLDG